VFVKPNNGVVRALARNPGWHHFLKTGIAAQKKLSGRDDQVLVEEFIRGRGIYTPLVFQAKEKLLLPVMSSQKKDFFVDYEAKYHRTSEEITYTKG